MNCNRVQFFRDKCYKLNKFVYWIQLGFDVKLASDVQPSKLYFIYLIKLSEYNNDSIITLNF